MSDAVPEDVPTSVPDTTDKPTEAEKMSDGKEGSAKAPEENGEAPAAVDSGEAPAAVENGEAPAAAESEAPAAESEAPGVESDAPAATESEAPAAVETEAPAAESETPAATESEAPAAAESEAPAAVESEAPAAAENGEAPAAVEDAAPAAEESGDKPAADDSADKPATEESGDKPAAEENGEKPAADESGDKAAGEAATVVVNGSSDDKAAEDAAPAAGEEKTEEKGLVGSYVHVKSENLSAFLTEAGVSWLKKASIKFNPTMDIRQNENSYTIKMHTMFQTRTITFSLGEEFNDKDFNSRPVKAVATMEDGKLILNTEPAEEGKGKPMKITRELKDNGLLMTMEIGEVVCRRHFKRSK